MTTFYPPHDQIYIFSTHAWTHLHRRDGFHSLLAPTWVKGVDYLDLSVTSRHPLDADDDAALAGQLRDRIAGIDALIIMAGMYLVDRFWMEFEIITAHAFGVPIIPVVWHGQERIPAMARKFAWCEPVRWRGDSIREKILLYLPDDRRRAFEDRRVRAAAAARPRPAPLPQRWNAGGALSPSAPAVGPSVFDLLGVAPPPRRLGALTPPPPSLFDNLDWANTLRTTPGAIRTPNALDPLGSISASNYLADILGDDPNDPLRGIGRRRY